jgi:hypothetical protein
MLIILWMRGDPGRSSVPDVFNTIILKTSGTISSLLKTYSLKFSSISPAVPEKGLLG